MTHVSHGWAFLVARGQRAGYRTVLAPGFLVDENLHHVLAESTGTSGVGAAGTRVVELDNAQVGPFSIGYTSERLARADVEEAESDSGELLTDVHGRQLEVVYGVVSRDSLEETLNAEDLQTARAHALHSYRRFLADEQGHRVDTSVAFALRTRGRARTVSASTSAAAGEHASSAPARTDRQHHRRWRLGRGAASAIAVAVALMLAAVGVVLLATSDAQKVTVYSSLPLKGPASAQSRDMVRGIRLALKQAGNRAAKFDVKHVSLDDATREARGWAPEAVVENALRAAEDDSTAVYIGEFSSGASAMSIPILSRAKVPQISPSNTAVGLTSDGPGADEGEPEQYYAGGFRNYVRVVPRDTIQGEALATVMREDGCQRAAILHDSEPYGRGLASNIRPSMTQQGLRRVLDEPVDSHLLSYQRRTLARRVANQHADCVVFSGDTTSEAVEIFKELARALPQARLYGSSGVADHAFTGRLPEDVAAQVKLTFPALGQEGFGAAGRDFFSKFAQEYPDNQNPDPYAIYGYEAMRLALDAIERAGTGDRADIVKALFDTKDRRSAIGTYSIDENGDTTMTDYGLFAIRDGSPIFRRTIDASGS